MNMRLCGTDPFVVTVAFALLTAATSTAGAELPPLIPREVLFGNPERVSPQISPDGERLAWIAPNTNNVLQVWVKTIGKDDDKVVTADKNMRYQQNLEGRRIALVVLGDSAMADRQIAP